MWYRKVEDNKRHKKVNSSIVGYRSSWWFDTNKGYFTYTKGHSNRRCSFYKNFSNRKIRRNKNEEYSKKGNLHKKVFDYWWQIC